MISFVPYKYKKKRKSALDMFTKICYTNVNKRKMATSKKKPISQDDLRRLMREKQSAVKSSNKKVEHPFAKYGYKCLWFFIPNEMPLLVGIICFRELI